MEQAPAHRRVFLSYRSTDRMMVGEFAARLRRDVVDAWYDLWEIAPGDDIVAKMDQGIDSCAAGLILISHAWLEGSWVHERVHPVGVAQGGDGIQLVRPCCASWPAGRGQATRLSGRPCWASTEGPAS